MKDHAQENKRHLFNRVTVLYGARLAGMAASFGWMIYLAQRLAPSELGYFLFHLALINVFAILISLNFGSTSIKFVPLYLQTGDDAKLFSYYALGRRITLSVWCLAFFAVLAGAFLLADGPGSLDKALPWILTVFASGLLASIQLEASYVRANDHVIDSVLPTALLQPVLLGVLLVVGIEAGLIQVASDILIAFLLVLVIIYFLQKIRFSAIVTTSQKVELITEDVRDWIVGAWHLFVPLLLLQNAANFTVSVAGGVLEAQDIAVLGVALKVMTVILFGINAVNMAFSPRISNQVLRRNREGIDRLLLQSGIYRVAILLSGGSVLLLFGDFVLSIFGEHYVEGALTLKILLLVPLISVVFGPVSLLATIDGRTGELMLAFSMAAVVTAVLCMALGAKFGVEGAATGLVLGWALWNVWMYVVVKLRIQIDLWIYRALRKNGCVDFQ